jgi:hypothetical protein
LSWSDLVAHRQSDSQVERIHVLSLLLTQLLQTFSLYPYGGLVIDYVPDSGQKPEDRIMQRRQIYNNNQIPAVVLGLNDLNNPNWQQLLYKQLEQNYHQAVGETNYSPSRNYD